MPRFGLVIADCSTAEFRIAAFEVSTVEVASKLRWTPGLMDYLCHRTMHAERSWRQPSDSTSHRSWSTSKTTCQFRHSGSSERASGHRAHGTASEPIRRSSLPQKPSKVSRNCTVEKMMRWSSMEMHEAGRAWACHKSSKTCTQISRLWLRWAACYGKCWSSQ